MAVNVILRWFWTLLPGNPLVVRTVQVGSRRMSHFWGRVGYLGALMLLVMFGLMTGGGMTGEHSMTALAKSGTQVFSVIAYTQVTLICLIAPLFMAGAISQEQAGETFDILLTTPLSNVQIVLGALAGRLFFVLALLAAGVPLFSVLLVFGGVPVDAIFVSFAVAGLVALAVGAVAVALAVLRIGGRKAVFTFVVAVAAYMVAGYGVDMAVRQLPSSQAGQTTWLTPLHPLLVLDSFLQADYQPPSPAELAGWPAPVQFYLGRPLAAFAVITIGMSLALLGISAVFVRRLGEGWQLPAGLRRFLRIKAAGGERRRPARTVWHNPIAWREANTRAQGTIGILSRWAFATLAVLGAIGWILAYHFQALPTIGNQTQAQTFKDGLQLVLLIEIAVISLVAIYMAAGCISREREDGTLDLVLTTPVTPKYLVWGKLRGLIGFLSLLIAAPVLTVALVAAYSGVGGWLDWPQATMTYHVFGPSGGRIQTRQPLLLPEVALLFPMLLVPFTAFCVALGVSWSLKAKGVLGAILPSVGIIGVLSVVLGFCGYGALQVPLIGPILNAFSPTTNVLMLINPWEHVEGFGQGRAGEVTGRSSLVLAALICVAVYGGIVYGMILAMVRNFDQTVRRLSGTGG